MALTNVERQLRWREKNRALWNLRRRQYRKKDLGLEEKESEAESEMFRVKATTKEIVGIKTRKVGEFRMIEIESQEPSETVEVARPVVFRNDYGAIITESQWERLQTIKDRAKNGGYVIDEYSQ